MPARALALAFVATLTAAAATSAGPIAPAAGDAQTPRPSPAPATPATPQPPVQARPGWTDADDSPRTDQTVDVARGTRLVLSSHAGEATLSLIHISEPTRPY